MKTFNIVVADPVVVFIHVVGFTLREPHGGPIALSLQLAYFVIAQEARRFCEITLCSVLKRLGQDAIFTLILERKRSTISRQT